MGIWEQTKQSSDIKNAQFSPPQFRSSVKHITVIHLGHHVHIDDICQELIETKGASRYRNAYRLSTKSGHAWLFDYGVLVLWDISDQQRTKLCHFISRLLCTHVSTDVSEQYGYMINPKDHLDIHNDVISIPDDDDMTILSISHALAQSSKLIFLDARVNQLIQDNLYLNKSLSRSGKIPLTRKALAKLRGQLFDAASDVALNYGLFDTPNFFWDYPEMEPRYQAVTRYLDFKSRINTLDRKRETLHEFLEMLAAEQHRKHASFLEWIIITLIAINVVMYAL